MRREKVHIGCGAGFGGDRPLAALKLLQRVDLNYIVLECLAERTLADLYHAEEAGGEGYDPRSMLFPLLNFHFISLKHCSYICIYCLISERTKLVKFIGLPSGN
ncbi:hypothetical protein CsSME_00012708 [Camellia sinensis var. sinensis]